MFSGLFIFAWFRGLHRYFPIGATITVREVRIGCFSIDDLGGPSVSAVLDALVGEGRSEHRGLGHWALTVDAVGGTAKSSVDLQARLLADVRSLLPSGKGMFSTRELVRQKGWNYPNAISTCLSLVRQGRLERHALI